MEVCKENWQADLESEDNIYVAPNMWLRSSVGSSARLLSGRHGSNPSKPEFFRLNICNCLNFNLPVKIISSLVIMHRSNMSYDL